MHKFGKCKSVVTPKNSTVVTKKWVTWTGSSNKSSVSKLVDKPTDSEGELENFSSSESLEIYDTSEEIENYIDNDRDQKDSHMDKVT